MLGLKFIKFLMSILKQQVNSSSDFASFFTAMTHNFSLNFQLKLFLLWIKGPHQIPSLRLSSAMVKICQIPHVIFQTTSKFFLKLWITFQCHERYLLCTFLGQTLNTLHNRNKWKCKFLRVLIAQVKFHQILVIFETTDQFFFKFCINFQGHET